MRSALVNAEALACVGQARRRWARASRSGAARSSGPSASRRTCSPTRPRRSWRRSTSARGLEGARALVRGRGGRAVRARRDAERGRPEERAAGAGAGAGDAGADVPRRRRARRTPHEQIFEVEVLVGERGLARGEGRSKRLAERAAAAQALRTMMSIRKRPRRSDGCLGERPCDAIWGGEGRGP